MRISVAAIRPQANSIGPDGIHLRWTLPRQKTTLPFTDSTNLIGLGFPHDGFKIYRRESGFTPDSIDSVNTTLLNFPDITSEVTPEQIETVQAFFFPESGVVLQKVDETLQVMASGRLLIRFREPIVRCQIGYRSPDPKVPNEIWAYKGKQLVSHTEVPVSEITGSVTGPYIDHVITTLNCFSLNQIWFTTEQQFCDYDDWKEIIELSPIQTLDPETALGRLETGLKNRFAENEEKAHQKYNPHVEEITQRAAEMVGDNIDATISQDDPPDNCPHVAQIGSLSIKDLFNTLTVDPNLARIVGLYWVDQYDPKLNPAAIGPPGVEQSYDYKVEGIYHGNTVICGLTLEVGGTDSPLPVEPKISNAKKLTGIYWQNENPLARVGLYIEHERVPGPTATVLYDVYRQSEDQSSSSWLTLETPVPTIRTNGVADFIDTNVPLNEYEYRVSSIDVFGQQSEVSEPEKIAVYDLSPPTPPVNLKCSVEQPGFPWLDPDKVEELVADESANLNSANIQLSFEYGYVQHRQSPDAKEFTLYWRTESLRSTLAADAIEVTTSGAATTGVVLNGLTTEQIQEFEGGILKIIERNGTPLPYDQQYPTYIQSITSDQINLGAEVGIEVGDLCELIGDIHNRDNWQSISETISIKPPIEGTVSDLRDLVVTIGDQRLISSADASEQNDISNTFPDTLSPTSPELSVVQEILINRDLLESDLFSGGKLITSDNQQTEILYSTSGLAFTSNSQHTLTSRIGVDHETDLQETVASLASPEIHDAYGDPIKSVIKELIIDKPPTEFELSSSGGEVVFELELEICGKKEIVPITARVVSSARETDESLTSLVVKIRKSDWDEYNKSGFIAAKSILYYAPYVADPLTATIAMPTNTDTLDSPYWSWSADDGVLKGFIAATTIDDGFNEGPLSHPVESSAFKPPPIGKPNAPIPCELTEDSEEVDKWYASPPDLDGNATVCLKWKPDGIYPTQGLRCEIARALDTTIIEADKKNWFLGLHEAGFSPVPIDIISTRNPIEDDGDLPAGAVIVSFKPLNNEVNSQWLTNGVFVQNDKWFRFIGEHLTAIDDTTDTHTFEVPVKLDKNSIDLSEDTHFFSGGILAPNETVVSADNFPVETRSNGNLSLEMESTGELDLSDVNVRSELVGGRIASDTGEDTNYFKITSVLPNLGDDGEADDSYSLLLQPQNRNKLALGSQIKISSKVKYLISDKDNFTLRKLADKRYNISAFGVVTGTPIKSDNSRFKFRDQLPGLGSNRYFYKARAKSDGQLDTSWSPASVPIHQVDLSPPDLPEGFVVRPADREIRLSWIFDPDPNISGYRLFRTERIIYEESEELETKTLISSDKVDRHPILVTGGSIILPRLVDGVIDDIRIFKTGINSSKNNLFIRASDLTTIENRIVSNINPLVVDGTKVSITLNSFSNVVEITRRPGSGDELQVENSKIDLSYGLDVISIEAIVDRRYFNDNFELEYFSQNYNLLNNSDVAIEFSNLTISGLQHYVDNSTPVVAVVRLASNELQTIKHTPGTDNQLRVENGSVKLDLEVKNEGVRSIKLLTGQYQDMDARIREVSTLESFNSRGRSLIGLKKINPLIKDETSVVVELSQIDLPILRIESDESRCLWVDTDVSEGNDYSYKMQVIKRVRPDATHTPLMIYSPETKEISSKAQNRMELEPPLLKEISWTSSLDDAVSYTVRLEIILPKVATLIWVERASIADGLWHSAPLDIGQGWVKVPGSVPNVVAFDNHAQPETHWFYRARYQASDGRSSLTTEAQELQPLGS